MLSFGVFFLDSESQDRLNYFLAEQVIKIQNSSCECATQGHELLK